jgi:transketolase N-terminal domain/subunit
VGFNHFFRGKDEGDGGDQIFFQGHAAPGIYARAFLEGRLTQERLENFRHETRPAGGWSAAAILQEQRNNMGREEFRKLGDLVCYLSEAG